MLGSLQLWQVSLFLRSFNKIPSLSFCLSLLSPPHPFLLPLVCLGKECLRVHEKARFWGSGRGAASVPGKNTFISFHMDGAWWACFNVPWAQGVVWLYGVFYYLMGKKVYRYSKAPNPAWYPLIGKTYCFLKKKKCIVWGRRGKKDLHQERIILWKSSSSLNRGKSMFWFLLRRLPFCRRKGQWKENLIASFPLPQRKASIGHMKQHFFV